MVLGRSFALTLSKPDPHDLAFLDGGPGGRADLPAGVVPEVPASDPPPEDINLASSGDSTSVEHVLPAPVAFLEPVVPAMSHDVDRARRGDKAAFERLARAELPRVERLLGRILGPRPDLEDLVQIVFLEVCRALPRFRGDSAVSTFVGGITVQVARRAMRAPAWVRRRGEMPDETEAAEAGPERGASAREQLRRLRAALEQIAEPKRIAFVLWALDGVEVVEIARITGVSVAAVRSRIFAATRELRALATDDAYLRELLGGGEP